MTHARLRDGILEDLQSLNVKLIRPVVGLVKEGLIFLLNVPCFIALIGDKLLVQLTVSPKESAIFQILRQTMVHTRGLLQHDFRAKGVLFSNEELDDVADDLTDVGRQGRAVRVHFIDHQLQKMAHPCKHMVLQSLSLAHEELALVHSHVRRRPLRVEHRGLSEANRLADSTHGARTS